jgi:hypothetical protein
VETTEEECMSTEVTPTGIIQALLTAQHIEGFPEGIDVPAPYRMDYALQNYLWYAVVAGCKAALTDPPTLATVVRMLDAGARAGGDQGGIVEAMEAATRG